MENNAALVAGLIAVVVAALMYVIAYPFLSGDAKAQKRAAALMTNTKERSVAARTSNDPAKRRKAIADTLKEFESQSKKKKVDDRTAHRAGGAHHHAHRLFHR